MSRLEKALERAKQARDKGEENRKGIATSLPESGGRAGLSKYLDPEYTQTRIENVDESALSSLGVLTTSIHPAIVEQYNLLRVKVVEALSRDGYNSLMVASPKQGEGKTFTAVNLAISLTRERTRTVLLIDTDMRLPSVHSYFGLPQGPGLYEYLDRGMPLSELLVNPGIPRLTLLPAGKAEQYPSDFLNAPAMHSFVREVKERYPDRYIIFDSPPLLAFSDGLYLSRFADAVIMVVRCQETKEEDLKRALELLHDHHIIGTVLNRVPRELSEWRDYKKYYQ